MKPYTPHTFFSFKTILERNNGSQETEEEIEVTVKVTRYSDAVGFSGECCGRKVFEITDLLHDGLPLSSLELAELHEQAENQLSFH